MCVDGTFLTGKYKGQILTTIATDENNQVLLVAFAFVESENTDSLLWFLRNLRVSVVQGRPNVCVIHDRHAGPLSAITQLQHGENEQLPWVVSTIKSPIL